MATTPRRTPAHQMFINLLFGYYVHCGTFHEAVIAAVAGRIHELYPDYRGGKVTGLSAINVYKILRGHHQKLLTTGQLSVLVLTLQHLAYSEHVREHDPGCTTLAGWQALLSQAKALDRHQKAQGLFIRSTADDVSEPLHLPEPPTAPRAASAVPGSIALVNTAPIRVTSIELHELIALGVHARMLALRAANADHRAFYELAVILGTANAPHDQRAVSFAIAAAAAALGPSPASDLLNSDATLNTDRAASHARVLAHAAADRDDHDAVRIFNHCADRVDNPGLRTRAPRLRD